MYATITKEGRFNGVVYNELTAVVLKYHKDNGLRYTETDGLVEIETEGEESGETEYGLPTSEQIQYELPTSEQIEFYISALVQSYLDEAAVGWGYDSIRSAVSYITSIKPEFKAEAKMFDDFRSDVWTFLYDEFQKVKQGLRGIPQTDELIIAELPKLETYQEQHNLYYEG